MNKYSKEQSFNCLAHRKLLIWSIHWQSVRSYAHRMTEGLFIPSEYRHGVTVDNDGDSEVEALL